MNKSLLAAVVSGALALPMAAQVQADEAEVQPHSHSATVYGSLRFGAMTNGGDAETSWDLGSNHGSRFGVKGSADVGNGLAAGFQIERSVGATLGVRHHNVSLTGPFGTAKFGQQSAPYYGATTWDGSNYLGGQTDAILRANGVSFSSDLGGPFGFAVFLSDSNDVNGDRDTTTMSMESGDGADHIEVTGSLAAGSITLNAGYRQTADDADRIGGTVGGTVANFNWEVGYESATDATCKAETDASTTHTAGTDEHVTTAATLAVMCDSDRYGFHLGYAMGEGVGGGNAYVQYGESDADYDLADLEYWVFGYAYYLADTVTIAAEHRLMDTTTATGARSDTTSVVVVKVDF